MSQVGSDRVFSNWVYDGVVRPVSVRIRSPVLKGVDAPLEQARHLSQSVHQYTDCGGTTTDPLDVKYGSRGSWGPDGRRTLESPEWGFP